MREILLANAASSKEDLGVRRPNKNAHAGLHRIHLSTAYSADISLQGTDDYAVAEKQRNSHQGFPSLLTSSSLLDSVFNASFKRSDSISPNLSPNSSRPSSLGSLAPPHQNISPNSSRPTSLLRVDTLTTSPPSVPGVERSSHSAVVPSSSSHIVYRQRVAGAIQGCHSERGINDDTRCDEDDEDEDEASTSLLAVLNMRESSHHHASKSSELASLAMHSALFKRSSSSLRPASLDLGRRNHADGHDSAPSEGAHGFIFKRTSSSLRPASLDIGRVCGNRAEVIEGDGLTPADHEPCGPLVRAPSSGLPSPLSHQSGSGPHHQQHMVKDRNVVEDADQKRFQRGLSLSVLSRGASRNM